MQTPAPALASLSARTPANPVRGIFARAARTPGCIRLEAGQPDFRTPDHICAAAEEAIRGGWHGYTPVGGLPSLRERIAAKLGRVNGIAADASRIVLANGGTGAISGAVMALAEAGDEVLVPDPAWPGYNGSVALSGATVVRYPCPAAGGYMPDLERLDALVTPRAKVLLVNSPQNPTGVVYPPEMLRALGGIAERHGLWVLSDECYDQIVLDGGTDRASAAPGETAVRRSVRLPGGETVAPTMLAHADPSRVVACFSFSKTYAMTGWRVGYATGPAEAIEAMTKAIDGMGSSITTIGQKAAEAALDGPQDCVGEMVAAYRRRRDLATGLLREAELLVSVPTGAFYAMADVSPSGVPSIELTERLLTERNVAVAPGIAYGPGGEGAVRLSLASADGDLREGIARLAALVHELAGAR